MVLRERSYDYQFRYCGHCNTTTDIKEANFFGRSEAPSRRRVHITVGGKGLRGRAAWETYFGGTRGLALPLYPQVPQAASVSLSVRRNQPQHCAVRTDWPGWRQCLKFPLPPAPTLCLVSRSLLALSGHLELLSAAKGRQEL